MDVLLLALRLLLAILLYGFLGAVVFVLWRDLLQATTRREAVRPSGQLVVLDAETEEADGRHPGEDGLAVGTVFPLQLLNSIGRSPSNTILVPDTYASAQHTLMTWREGQWWVEDLDSRNGTLLNGVCITGPTVVSAGDVIGVGRTRLKLETEMITPGRQERQENQENQEIS
jgi:pSer/pThr/pTyr-binding forkhead associated (FHA) protein